MRDTGVGIAAEQIGLIFEEFYQVGVSPNSSREGYGLGLSIVQRIARLLDIRVDVSSQPGQGLGLRHRAAVGGSAGRYHDLERPAGPARGQPMPRATSCWWRTSPACATPCARCSGSAGYRVTAAASAEEALAELRNQTFDLLVTDYHLESGRTGTQVIAAARERHGAGFKAILVTGDTSAAIREMQVDAKLRIASKPINSEELLAQVRALLSAVI